MDQSDPRPDVDPAARIAALEAELAAARREQGATAEVLRAKSDELTETLEYQSAIDDVLGLISLRPTSLQQIFDAVLERGTRLCGASGSHLVLYDGKIITSAATFGLDANVTSAMRSRYSSPPDRKTIAGRVVLSGTTLQVPDLLNDADYKGPVATIGGFRSIVGVPLIRDGQPAGAIVVGRPAPAPFGEKQIRLLETFASQAVIAIENARLFEAEQARNRELQRALETQTAMSEVLGVISATPTDSQPVFDAIAVSVRNLTGSVQASVYTYDGTLINLVAIDGIEGAGVDALRASFPQKPGRTGATSRAIASGEVHYIPDVAADADYGPTQVASSMGYRSIVSVPMLREGKAVGAITASAPAVAGIGDDRIALLKTFASQAVIAINNARLFEAEQARTRELAESLEYQTAMSELLSVISRSPSEVQPVFDAIVATARRLCDAGRASVWRIDGGEFRHVASSGMEPSGIADVKSVRLPLGEGSIPGRAAIAGRAIQALDPSTDPNLSEAAVRALREGNIKTYLTVPLMLHGQAIGTITLTRKVVQPFTRRQIALVETFASQAVIAIENARLFEAERERTRELAESLDNQTAISGVLEVMSRSKFELQPVLERIVQTVARLGQADKVSLRRKQGEEYALIASTGFTDAQLQFVLSQGSRFEPGTGYFGRVISEKRVIHAPDLVADGRHPWLGAIAEMGIQSGLGVPLLQNGELTGGFMLWRSNKEPFTSRQISLVETFADQAVIAIENARLLDELQTRQRELEARSTELAQSLEYQTAISEVLSVISRSKSELQPVLDTIVSTAARLCSPDVAGVLLRRDGKYHIQAFHGFDEAYRRYAVDNPVEPGRGNIIGRAAVEKRTVHVEDVLADPEWTTIEGQKLAGYRTIVSTPLLRDGDVIGVISLGRTAVSPFTPPQIALLETFANQAIIAIENARLLDELQTRQRELTESLEYQTAAGSVLGIIARSPGELQPVLDSVITTSARLCRADNAILYRLQGGKLRLVAGHGHNSELIEIAKNYAHDLNDDTAVGRAVRDRKAVEIPDTLQDQNYQLKEWGQRGVRSLIGVPLMRHGEPIGAIALARGRVEPFTPREIEIVSTFADQAVIAIENARLLEELQTRQRELQNSLDHRTATTEILEVIARSPGTLERVFEAIADNAAKICAPADARVFRLCDDRLLRVASSSRGTLLNPNTTAAPSQLKLGRGTVTGRAIVDRRTIHISDLKAELASEFPDASPNQSAVGHRTILATPLLRQDRPLGALVVARPLVEPFSRDQQQLFETFADQAVIAIENARLLDELQTRQRELQESLDFQKATSGVLDVILRSLGDVEPVLNAVASTSKQLCVADRAIVWRVDGDVLQPISFSGMDNDRIERIRNVRLPLDRNSMVGRSILDGRAAQVVDPESDPALAARNNQFQTARGVEKETVLGVPLMLEGKAFGAISVSRQRILPFTERQIALVETFADQAVIAIENARLLDELQTRQQELTESLEYQTAISDVLDTISRSRSEVQPVLDEIVQTAARLGEADVVAMRRRIDGEFRTVADHNYSQEQRAWFVKNFTPPPPQSAMGRAIAERRTIHAPDAYSDPALASTEAAQNLSTRSLLVVPLQRGDDLIGTLFLGRRVQRPFTNRQIALIETFADQAVIAIENARLLDELQTRQRELTESLAYQTAMSSILGAISRAQFDLDLLLEKIVQAAAELGGADKVSLRRCEGAMTHLAAAHGFSEEQLAIIKKPREFPLGRGFIGTLLDRKATLHVPDLRSGGWDQMVPNAVELMRVESALGVPLLRDNEVLGTLVLWSTKQKVFDPAQIRLVEAFADQAVIAIENARLLDELQTRQKELAQSVDELRSLGEVGRAVSSSLDMPKVLQTVLENACRMTFAGGGTIYVYDAASQEFRLEAGYNMSEEHTARVRAQPMRLGDAVVGECAERREAVQIEDLGAIDAARSPLIGILLRAGVRAILAVPLLHQNEVIGALVVRRSYPGAFSAETVRLLEAFAAQSAIAVNNARLFKEVEEKGEQLRLASQHKSQFLANMSHELRTPLNAILGYTELMQDGIYGALPEKAAGVLDRVQSNGRHLLGLINSVLDLSKIEAGQLKLSLAEYSIGGIVETVMVATESLATEKKLKLASEVAPDLPRGVGDEQRIVQVLLNLVGNAIKFTETGEVRIHAGLFAGRFQIAVADTGPGIPQAELGRIFEEFHQVDSSNTKVKGGTGLGLAIAKRIVELHGGRIWVESAPAKGATFRFELPVVATLRENDHDETHTRH